MWNSIDERFRELERLLWAIEIHGPAAIFTKRRLDLFRRMEKGDRAAFVEVLWALQESGMERDDALSLVRRQGTHVLGCACWQCVLTLNATVTKMVARWRAQSEETPDAGDHEPREA